jgi:hypothetical protein
MKVKITHPCPEYGLEAGLDYELPDEIAREIIEADKGIAVEAEPEPKRPRRKKEPEA